MPGGSLREALAATAQIQKDIEATLMPFRRILVLLVSTEPSCFLKLVDVLLRMHEYTCLLALIPLPVVSQRN